MAKHKSEDVYSSFNLIMRYVGGREGEQQGGGRGTGVLKRGVKSEGVYSSFNLIMRYVGGRNH